VYGLFRRWQRNGTWREILAGLQGRADAEGLITWDVSVDSTVARAHQHAAGAQKGAVAMSRQVHRAPGPQPGRASRPTTASAGPAAG
jgi:transposase